MHHHPLARLTFAFALLLALLTTGCFRVSSETRALRDAALDHGLSSAESKFELGVGFLTVSAARFWLKFVDLPPEARTAVEALHGAEVSVCQVRALPENPAEIISSADRAMARYGCYRLTGVVQRDQVVAIYVPHSMKSTHNVRFNVLVLNRDQLICASARGDLRDLLELALVKMRENQPGNFISSQLARGADNSSSRGADISASGAVTPSARGADIPSARGADIPAARGAGVLAGGWPGRPAPIEQPPQTSPHDL